MHLLHFSSLAMFAATATWAAAPERIPQFPFQKYSLPNGLQVILQPDHSTPIVGVNLWYHVGSKNERPGRTGFAHLFEHMMFQGSKHYDRDYFAPVLGVGGKVNGSTSIDRTNYWEMVPATDLERALWLESDRMAFLLPAMTQAKFANQRDVVKNERRQSMENRPYGLARELLSAALYPPDHPYSWPVIGSMADLDQAKLEDVADFFRRYYHPGNASLCIAGDFQPEEARRLVAKYFGPIAAGPKVEELAARPVELGHEKRMRMVDRVGLPRVYLAWPSVPVFHADEPALKVLADVLSGGKTSRLDQALVRRRQIAQEVEASQSSGELAGEFYVVATGRAETAPADVGRAILEEVDRLRQSGPDGEELTRALARIEVQMIRALESVSGFGSRADQMNKYNVFTGDPGYIAKDFRRYLGVTGGDVQRAAQRYLGPSRVVLEVIPGPQRTITDDPRGAAEQARQHLARAAAAVPPVEPPPLPAESPWSALPVVGPSGELKLPPPARVRLECGLELVVVENHELPTVAMSLLVPGGRSADPPDRPGLGALLAAAWDEGTASRTAEQIADQLAQRGASLAVELGWDWFTLQLTSLTRQLPEVLEIFADVVRNPALPEPELAREKKQALGQLLQLRSEPNALAVLALGAALYGPDHPYGQPSRGTPQSIAAITRADLEAHYRRLMHPKRATLIAVGDITATALVPLLDRVFAQWRAGSGAALPDLAAPPPPEPTRLLLVDKPQAAQSVIAVGQVGIRRDSPDYYALTVANAVLGGQFMSRLNLNLREDKGYTYGAGTRLDWRKRQPGPLLGMSSVHTTVTASALSEFLKEFEAIAGARPAAPDELDFARSWLTKGYAADFETPAQLARQLETLVGFQLPDDFFNTFVPRMQAVGPGAVLDAARRHVHPGQLTVVVVGDRAKIEPELRKLPLGKRMQVLRLDDHFRFVPAQPAAQPR